MGRYYNSPPIVTNGLILNLDSINNKSYPATGSIWSDLSGNNKNGTLVNSPVYETNKGMVFNGSNYVNLTPPSYNTNSVTISMLIKYDTPVSDYPCLFGNGTNNSNMSFYSIVLGPVYGGNIGKIIVVYKADTVNQISSRTIMTSTTSLVGSWNYIVSTYKANEYARLYVNGKLDAETAISTGNLNPHTGSFFIGGGSPVPVGSTPYVGTISTFQMYDRELSSTEINQNYNAIKNRFL